MGLVGLMSSLWKRSSNLPSKSGTLACSIIYYMIQAPPVYASTIVEHWVKMLSMQ